MSIKSAFQSIGKVKIGGYIFTLRPVREDMEMASFDAAEINYRSQNISYITDRLIKGECILHECLHGVTRFAGLDTSEEVVKPLSYALYAFMRDNAVLVVQILRENNEEQVDRMLLQLIERSGNKYPEETNVEADKKTA